MGLVTDLRRPQTAGFPGVYRSCFSEVHVFLLKLVSLSKKRVAAKPAEKKLQGDLLLRSIKRPNFSIRDTPEIEFVYSKYQFLILVFFLFSTTYVDDFTGTEALGDYRIDVSQKSFPHIQATVKNDEKDGV